MILAIFIESLHNSTQIVLIMGLRYDSMKPGAIAGYERKRVNGMKKRDYERNGWFYVLLGSVLFLGACSQAMEPATSHESTKKEFSMSVESDLPAIDSIATPIVETASFGLG